MYIPQSISQPDSEQKARKKTGQEVYFQGNKKNQLNDLKKYFKTILLDQSKASARKQIIRKIINQTTRGVDTQRLFPEMVLASMTKDLVQKKMIYFYLINFSKNNESFARMAINTFLKDSSSPNPNIRALSLRHLSNLRFKGRDQYVLPLLKKGLGDFSPLVKKSSIMGLSKLINQKNRFVQEPQREQQILNQLYSLLRDTDSGVVCCALEAINQIQPEGLVMNKKLANYLLDNLSNFNEYQLPIVLKYYELYEPKTQEQVINSMNTLYSKIRSSVLSVTLAIFKIYLRYADLYPQYLQSIIERVKRPLLSFLNHDCPQVQYVALKHIQYIIQKYESQVFLKDIKKFFLKCNEPTYIKLIKIKIIELNTKAQNFSDLINEISEYITDEQISKEAINSLERIMMKYQNEQDSKFIIKTIVKIIEQTWNDYLCNNALPAIRNFLRKYPDEFALFQNIFYTLVHKATQNQAKCSIIQIIGDYGQNIQDAIELIRWNDKQTSDTLKISMLRANVKLFLKRPLEMVNIITNMFNSILNDDEIHLYVKDYASFLYRSLMNDIQNFKQSFLQERKNEQILGSSLSKFQINSLQIIYLKPEYKWIIQKDKFLNEIQQVNFQEQQGQGENQEEIYNRDRRQSEQIKQNINVDSIYRQLEADDFDNEFQIDADEFEQKWSQYQVGASITRMLNNIDIINEQNLEELFKIWNIGVMASAQDEDTIKLYLYCKIKRTQQKSQIAMMQFQLMKLPQTMTLMVKSQDQQISGFISKYVEQFLKLNQII